MAESSEAEGTWRPSVVLDPEPFDRAGEILATAIADGLAERESVRLAIPGGSALEAGYKAYERAKSDWRRLRLTWVDERCVPVSDEASNRGAASRRGLPVLGRAHEGVEGPAVVLPLFEEGEAPEEAVHRVRRAWKRDFDEGLDLILLGMGADGHIASLFPSSPSIWERDIVAHVSQSPKPPSDRITLTRVALATARQGILVAAGEDKREALARLVSGDPALPAPGLEGLVVVTDMPLMENDPSGSSLRQ